MTGILPAFARAFGDLANARVLAVLGKSMAVTVVIVVAIAVVAWRGVALAIERYVGGYGELAGAAALLVAIIAGWLLFRIVALAVLQFFADDVVLAIEARDYPAAAAGARPLGLRREAGNALRGAARAALVNLAAVPFAVALLVTGVGTAILFWAVNAWLLGRELQDMVWLRHRPDAASGAPMGGLTRFALGGIVAAMLLIPFANLLAPVLGAAAATHLVHGRRARP